MYILRFHQSKEKRKRVFSDWRCRILHKVTLCDTFYHYPCRISPFEVKVASLHTGLRSDYSTTSSNLNSQPDVLRSDLRAFDVNSSAPHL